MASRTYVKEPDISWRELAWIFLKTGACSFGGWSTTVLLLEKELVSNKRLIGKERLHGSVAYAQLLPGATQVAIVSGVGYALRGIRGAVLSAIAYLLPALSLIVLFAALYFGYIQDEHLMDHMKGLIAALGGIILANAYHIGKRHVSHALLWVVVGLSIIAKLAFDVNAVVIMIVFGCAGLALSWTTMRRERI